MRPSTQGTFDGLCGIYAVLNSLDPAGLRRPRSKLHRDLFVQLTHALPASKLRAAMHEGLAAEDLVRATRIASQWLLANHGIALALERPFKRRRFRDPLDYFNELAAIEKASACGIIFSFRTSSMAHWTVLSEVRARSLLLRDSIGWRGMELAKFVEGKYRAYPADTLILRLAERC